MMCPCLKPRVRCWTNAKDRRNRGAVVAATFVRVALNRLHMLSLPCFEGKVGSDTLTEPAANRQAPNQKTSETKAPDPSSLN